MEWVKGIEPSSQKWFKMLLYLDGNLVAATNTPIRPFAALTGPNPGLGIGNLESDTYAEYFEGNIAEVRISDVALSPNQLLNAVPAIFVRQPQKTGNLVAVSFEVSSGNTHSCSLLEANEVGGPWHTNTGSILSTNKPGVYTFEIPSVSTPSQFFRVVQSP